MGYDAFGLPAEQFAVQTGQHPRVTTEANIEAIRAQLRRLGVDHDDRRSFATIDPGYYKWTQWIFLQIFGSWFDEDAGKARPIEELVAELDAGTRQPAPGTNPSGRPWAELDEVERRKVVDAHRLAYLHQAPVNWCPGLGTVLSNEEVTADGRSERGNFPVFRRPLTQWMMRITAYADRLLDDLDRLDWSDSLKLMQRNWIGRSTGARIGFSLRERDDRGLHHPARTRCSAPPTWCWPPSTRWSTALTADAWPDGTDPRWTGGAATPAEAVAAYQRQASRRSELDRQTEGRDKTGVWLGVTAVNPVNGRELPVFIADYVLTGYGTGAIMARARRGRPRLGVRRGVRAARRPHGAAAGGLRRRRVHRRRPDDQLGQRRDLAGRPGQGRPRSPPSPSGWSRTATARRRPPTSCATGCSAGSATGASRSRSSTTRTTCRSPSRSRCCRCCCPRSTTTRRRPSPTTTPTPRPSRRCRGPPSGRRSSWTWATARGSTAARPTRCPTGPARAGTTCATWTRATTSGWSTRSWSSYWLGPREPGDVGGVDLYVGGVEHAVLHLLYARFWHKVLHDLGYVSSEEPFRRLVNQGYISAYAYTDERGFYVPAAEVVEKDGQFFYEGKPVNREYGKIGKSLKNMVTPDEMIGAYGADTFRVYEMSTGPLDQSRPWETKAVVGSQRLLQRIWRVVVDEQTGAVRAADVEPDEDTLRALHRTIAGVRDGFATLRFNIAIARITELTNHLTAAYGADVAGAAVGRRAAGAAGRAAGPAHGRGAVGAAGPRRRRWPGTRSRWPTSAGWSTTPCRSPSRSTARCASQVTVPADADAAALEAAARADEKIAGYLDGATVRRVVAVPGRLVNFVLG